MKYMRYVGKCTKADKINETIRSDLIRSANDKLEENKTKWNIHVDRTIENRY